MKNTRLKIVLAIVLVLVLSITYLNATVTFAKYLIDLGKIATVSLKLISQRDYYYYQIIDPSTNAVARFGGTIPADTTTTQVGTYTTEWTDGGWYIVESGSTINISSRINVSGTVNLILEDGATLNANAGIEIEERGTLNIYVQKKGTGTLNATATTDNQAGIACTSATLNIHGSTIRAEGCQTSDGSGGAGIGGNTGKAGGTVTIYDGTITATSESDGAGIGGGNEGVGGITKIYGGIVTATAGKYGAGIGSGDSTLENNKGVCKTYIYSGTVTATGGVGAAGIGGGDLSAGGLTEIYGGKIYATGKFLTGNSGTGIGQGIGSGRANKGEPYSPGTTNIYGNAYVEAKSLDSQGAVIIDDSYTYAYGQGCGIGRIDYSNTNYYDNAWGGHVVQDGGKRVYINCEADWKEANQTAKDDGSLYYFGDNSNLILQHNYYINHDETNRPAQYEQNGFDVYYEITVQQNPLPVTCNFIDNYSLWNDKVYGRKDGTVTLTAISTPALHLGNMLVKQGTETTESYDNGNYDDGYQFTVTDCSTIRFGISYQKRDAPQGPDYEASHNGEYTVVTNGSTDNFSDGWYVFAGTINYSSRLEISGNNVHFILADNCHVKSAATTAVSRGIHLKTGHTLTVYSQSIGGETMGKLTAECYESGASGIREAGIGGNNSEPGGNLTVYGGNITAKGGVYSAGIGGSNGSESDTGQQNPGGTVIIYNGIVDATGGAAGAGIGGGDFSYGGTVEIYGGTVTAKGGPQSPTVNTDPNLNNFKGRPQGIGAGRMWTKQLDADTSGARHGTFRIQGADANVTVYSYRDETGNAVCIGDRSSESNWLGTVTEIILNDNGSVYSPSSAAQVEADAQLSTPTSPAADTVIPVPDPELPPETTEAQNPDPELPPETTEASDSDPEHPPETTEAQDPDPEHPPETTETPASDPKHPPETTEASDPDPESTVESSEDPQVPFGNKEITEEALLPPDPELPETTQAKEATQ